MKNIIFIIICSGVLAHGEENIITKIQARLSPEPETKSIVEANDWIGDAVRNIKELPKPWTVETLIAMHDAPRFKSKRADIVMLLAASNDEKGLALIGKYIEPDKRHQPLEEMDFLVDVYRAVDVFLVDHSESIRLHGGYGGNLESSIIGGKKWWKEYKKSKRDQAMERWQASWDHTENKDGLDNETAKAIAGRLASGDLNDIRKSIADLKTRRAVNTLVKLLDYPNDLILKETAGALVSFPTKEVAEALFTKLKELDSALAGGTHGIVAQEQAISAVAKSLFGITKIEATPDFSDHEKRNQAIESALGKMASEK